MQVIFRLMLFFILLSLLSCFTDQAANNDSANTTNHEMADACNLIKTGDLILRTGADYSSEHIRQFSRQDKTYSHAGIAQIDSGRIFVYHIEPAAHGKDNMVRKELLDSFCKQSSNLGFGIARYQMNKDEMLRFIQYMEKQYLNNVSFDMDFDLATDDKMYCSEMIKKALHQATNGKVCIETDPLNSKMHYKLIRKYFGKNESEVANKDVVAIDRLFLNQHCKIVRQYSYNK